MKYLKLISNPNEFFNGLYKDNNYKKHIYTLVTLAIIFFCFWFLRIFFLVLKPEVYTAEVELYRILFSEFNLRFIFAFFGILVLDILAYALVIMIISSILLLFMKMFKKRLIFNDYFKISIYSTIPYIFSVIIFFVLTLLNLAEFQIFISTISYIWSFILLIIGIKVFYSL